MCHELLHLLYEHLMFAVCFIYTDWSNEMDAYLSTHPNELRTLEDIFFITVIVRQWNNCLNHFNFVIALVTVIQLAKVFLLQDYTSTNLILVKTFCVKIILKTGLNFLHHLLNNLFYSYTSSSFLFYRKTLLCFLSSDIFFNVHVWLSNWIGRRRKTLKTTHTQTYY